MKKILILMAKFGGGHESLAKAMAEAIKSYSTKDIEVVIEDGFPSVFLFSDNYSSFIFFLQQGYKLTDNEQIAKFINLTNKVTIERHLQKIINQHKPDLIIVNHPMLPSAVTFAQRGFKKRIPLIVYFADATHIHALWFVEKNADYYFAPTQEVFDLALKRKIPKQKLSFIGWMLREEFYNADNDRAEVYKKNLGFNPAKKMIFLAGGGDGYGKIGEITKLLLADSYVQKNCQVVVVCGSNPLLLIKMQQLQRKHSDLLFSYGFIHNAQLFKKAADVVCSKAGPNDIFESIMLEKPFFAHNYLWGHEKSNFDWVKKKNIGFAEKEPTKLVKKIIECLKNPDSMKEKISNIKLLKKEHEKAPLTLVRRIEDII